MTTEDKMVGWHYQFDGHEFEQAPGAGQSTKIAQSYLSLSDPMDCSPPGSSVHGISQARILEWVAIPFSRGSS